MLQMSIQSKVFADPKKLHEMLADRDWNSKNEFQAETELRLRMQGLLQQSHAVSAFTPSYTLLLSIRLADIAASHSHRHSHLIHTPFTPLFTPPFQTLIHAPRRSTARPRDGTAA